MVKNCLYCNKEFNVPPCKIKEGKGLYCSRNCYHKHKSSKVKCLNCGKEFWKTNNLINAGRGKFCSKKCQNNYTPKQKYVNCDYCGTEFKAKESELKRNKNHYCCHECCVKDKTNKYSGKNSSNWRGGKQREKHNGNYKYSDWRLKVYERDNFTCQECGKKGGKLNAHHRFTWSEYPSLRYAIWNGITLCKECHKQEHIKIRRMKNEYSKKG